MRGQDTKQMVDVVSMTVQSAAIRLRQVYELILRAAHRAPDGGAQSAPKDNQEGDENA